MVEDELVQLKLEARGWRLEGAGSWEAMW